MSTNNAINQIGKLPSFMAVQNADQTNVTGDGSAYVPQYTNVIYDITGSFNGSTTFTAPLSGKYLFDFTFQFTGVTAAMTLGYIQLITTAATYNIFYSNPANLRGNNNVFSYSTCILCNMTATDTASLSMAFLNGTKVATLQGATISGVRAPMFAGYMITGI